MKKVIIFNNIKKGIVFLLFAVITVFIWCNGCQTPHTPPKPIDWSDTAQSAIPAPDTPAADTAQK